jgi:hypothetical protein
VTISGDFAVTANRVDGNETISCSAYGLKLHVEYVTEMESELWS